MWNSIVHSTKWSALLLILMGKSLYWTRMITVIAIPNLTQTFKTSAPECCIPLLCNFGNTVSISIWLVEHKMWNLFIVTILTPRACSMTLDDSSLLIKQLVRKEWRPRSCSQTRYCLGITSLFPKACHLLYRSETMSRNWHHYQQVISETLSDFSQH
jgi:hypothetical protein